MAVEFNGATEQYTGTLPAAIARPWTIVAWLSSSDSGGTFRWAAEWASTPTFRIGVYAQGPAGHRDGSDMAPINLGYFGTTPKPAIWQCKADSGIVRFTFWDDPDEEGSALHGAANFDITTAMTVNTGDYHSNSNKICLLAIYTGELGDDAKFRGQIFNSYHPLLVYRPNLVHAWDFYRADSTVQGLVGGVSLTRANSPTTADHPRVYLPGRRNRTSGTPPPPPPRKFFLIRGA